MNNIFKFNFLFYDYETFGINTALDKASQFACIRTDFNLRIISKPIVLYCYPPIDYLPDPKSVLITSITPYMTLRLGLNESNFSKKIYYYFNQPNSCILGYNNISFDDEITRNIFYRNFFDIYSWSWKNNNTRWDVINIARAFYALRPKGIKWPKNKDNLVSFKLSKLTRENFINHDKSHDALSDVYATIDLLKLFKKNNKKFFNFLFIMRKKKNILNLISNYYYQSVIYISSYYGSKNKNCGCVFPLTLHSEIKNILIVFDLNINYLSEKNINNFKNFNYDINYLFNLGMKFIYLNKCPILIPIDFLSNSDIIRLKINIEQQKKNIIFLKKFMNTNRILNISKVYFKKTKYKHIDLKLYEKFFSYLDQKNINILRSLINQNKFHNTIEIKDNRFSELIFFFKARNFPHILNLKEKILWLKYLKKFFNQTRILNYKKDIYFLKKKYYDQKNKIKLLNSLLDYLKYINESIQTFKKNITFK
ncbi:exodeoxyribonuclease I [Buchnera aphidicola]|uniref:exodeoxyribonuclease I n=1 Tax=Buchnera aphidicola TaxID=9 RepID=UPI002238DF6A|nr:exodeoxyribonuclease I [Buchnera aphidicola]MCW5197455.1 exodeoxyribonuclease I [Buchnera aphidicola (Chaitophorus viminalis)]